MNNNGTADRCGLVRHQKKAPHAEAFSSGYCLTGSTGGASRDRTDDPLLAKQVLSQLSYGP